MTEDPSHSVSNKPAKVPVTVEDITYNLFPEDRTKVLNFIIKASKKRLRKPQTYTEEQKAANRDKMLKLRDLRMAKKNASNHATTASSPEPMQID